MDWMVMVQGRDRWRALVDVVNWVCIKSGEFLDQLMTCYLLKRTAEWSWLVQSSSQRRCCQRLLCIRNTQVTQDTNRLIQRYVTNLTGPKNNLMLFRSRRAEREQRNCKNILHVGRQEREKIIYNMAICLLYIGRYPAVKVGCMCVYTGGRMIFLTEVCRNS